MTHAYPAFDQHVPPNGYRWWYFDAISSDGKQMLTAIAFVGSVFSPYYKFARRSAQANAENHCALNIALYGKSGGRWCMTERSQPGVTRKVDNYTIGPSRLSFYRDKSQYGVMQIDINEVTVPIPRLLQGRITVQLGNLSDKHYRLDKEGHHHWWPVSPASAVEVQFEKPACSWHGHAYLDTNWGDRPLEEDIDYWCWSRFQNKQQTLIHYDVFYKGNDAYRLPACEPDKGLAIRVNNDGTSTTDTPPSLKKLKKTNWQMTRHARSESNLKLVSTLEDSPFYSRSLIETTIDNESLMGICESVSLQKFRKPIVQMMLPFRMPRRTGPTSQIYPPSRNETG